MGRRGLAAPEKKLWEERVQLVLIAKGGIVLNPVARRTWAPRGRNPTLVRFGRNRDKLSTISVAPQRRRRLYWWTDPEHCIDAAGLARILWDLLQSLRSRVIVVWDDDSNHKGSAVSELCRRHSRLHPERLSTYTPDLNPVEVIWSYLKCGLMSNFAPRHVRQLERVVWGNLTDLGIDAGLIRSRWSCPKLQFPEKNRAN